MIQSDWFFGFLSGVLATVCGFLLTMLWDVHKQRRESKIREESILSTVSFELNANMITWQRNRQILERELELLGGHKSVVDPLTPLNITFWDLLQANLPFPRKLRDLHRSMSIIHAAQLTKEMNQAIAGREIYRLQNRATTDFFSHMKLCDKRLLEDGETLMKRLKELQPFLI